MRFTALTAAFLFISVSILISEIVLELINNRTIKQSIGTPNLELMQSGVMINTLQSMLYHLALSHYSIVHKIVSTSFTWFMILYGFDRMDFLARAFRLPSIGTGLLFIGFWAVTAYGVDLPFNLYYDFVLEARFGFNKKTIAVFLSDTMKAFGIGVLLAGAFLTVTLYIMQELVSVKWLVMGFILILVFLCVQWIFPVMILPLFHRVIPLDERLKSRINQLLVEAGVTTREVLAIDGSHRSEHANAFFTGFGKAKRIVIFDTLLSRIDEEETLAVIAHEAGHYRLRHFHQRSVIVFFGLFVTLVLLAYLERMPDFHVSFGFVHPSDYASLTIFAMLLTEAIRFFQWYLNTLSRKQEYAADAFAVNLIGNPLPLIHALEKLHECNLTVPVTHPAYASRFESHPNLNDRIAAIRRIP
ncbi:M48 family metallopeptidase [bacterium]|nr:M48 family metallopeptidase [candidate division CSSED10-310 bacterium]